MMPSASAIVVVMVVLVAVLLLLLLWSLRHTVAVVVVRMVVVVTRTSSSGYVNLSLVLSAASGGSGDSVTVLFEHRFQAAVGNSAVDGCGRKGNRAAITAAAVVVVIVVVVVRIGGVGAGGRACATAVETVGGRRCGEHAPGESDEELRDDSLQPYIL